ncbi:MAG: putative addiction module antidote protein [Chlamydiia bacterium]|nr:putative addiction module antidote protein [Chlamydiia bacterium]
MAKLTKYQKLLIERLKDREEAVAYLNAALQESLKNNPESRNLFLVALRNVAEAQGGLGQLAKQTGLSRESLYKTLSPAGNPTWHTLLSLSDVLGFSFLVDFSQAQR